MASKHSAYSVFFGAFFAQLFSSMFTCLFGALIPHLAIINENILEYIANSLFLYFGFSLLNKVRRKWKVIENLSIITNKYFRKQTAMRKNMKKQ